MKDNDNYCDPCEKYFKRIQVHRRGKKHSMVVMKQMREAANPPRITNYH